MKKRIKRLFFGFLYVVLIFLPVFVFLTIEKTLWRDFWRDLSVLLGFVGLSLAGFQFIPTTRLLFISDIYDMDRVYKIHHILSVLSILLVSAHLIVLLLINPNTLLLLNPITAPWRAQAGLIGLLCFIIVAITSIFRKEIRLGYNQWHWVHTFLSILMVVFGLIHIFKVNYYTAVFAMRISWIVEIVIWSANILYLRVLKPIQMKNHPFRVEKVIPETQDVWTLVIKPVEHAGLDFNAAQIAWININTSPFTLHRNPFSISGSAHIKDELRFTIKALGDFSSSIGNLNGGEIVYVDGPYGNFSLEDEKTTHGLVLLAGGIGIAPIMSILRTLADQKDKRPLYLFYGNYDEQSIVFKDEIEDLQTKLDLQIIHVLEQPSTNIECEHGFITQKILERYLPEHTSDLHFFLCGPLPMIKAMEKILRQKRIHNNQITAERYEMA